jgi:hypothetical protein
MAPRLELVLVMLGNTKLVLHALLIQIVKPVYYTALIAFSATALKVANPTDLLAALE